MVTWIWMNTGSGNGLLLGGTKPLPEPVFTNYQWGIVAFTWGQFHWEFSWYLSLIWVKIYDLISLSHMNPMGQWVNSLRPSDAIWWQGSRSTLVQVMACCLTAPSHYLNQCWLIISEVQWHSYQGNFTRIPQPSITKIRLTNYISKISFRIPWGQWDNVSEADVVPLVPGQHTMWHPEGHGGCEPGCTTRGLTLEDWTPCNKHQCAGGTQEETSATY